MLSKITFDNLPEAVELLLRKMDAIERFLNLEVQTPEQLPPTIPLKQAAGIAGKTPNALRVQISLGNLKCLHRGSRIYLDTAYFQRWIRGEQEPERNPLEILRK